MNTIQKTITSCVLLFVCLLLTSASDKNQFSSIYITQDEYQIGDIVKCSQWDNGSYWEGEVINVLKGVVYQIQLTTIEVKGASKLYLLPSECTGKKMLSFEDGEDYKQTKIWVHERCLD